MRNKKVWIGVTVLILLVMAVLFYMTYRARALSPTGEAELTSAGLTVSVSYSRPSVRGRLIFGPEERNALQPFGKYWRLGANKATEIAFDRDILFNGNPVEAGTYRMYAIPGADAFEIVLNTEVGKSGATQPGAENDVLRTKVPTQKTPAPVEQFTIRLAPMERGVEMVFEWSDTRVVVPLTVRD